MSIDFPFDYLITNSKRAHNLRISINSANKVILTKPWFIPKYLAIQFLNKNQNWVIEKLSQLKPTSEKNISDENSIYYLGKKFKIKFKKGKLNFDLNNTTLTITSYSERAGKKAFLEKLQTEAKIKIKTSAKKFSLLMNQKYHQIRLKSQSTRWGSASSQSNLNFNWRLIMSLPEVLDYVVIHELAHFKHMDHSRNFWQYVEKFDPDYREHRRWLHKHQSALSDFMI